MKKFLWILTILGSILGLLILILGLQGTNSAPQESSITALAIACAVIPYCLARAVSEMNK